MTLSDVDILGNIIGSLSTEQDVIRQNLSPDESAAQDIIAVTANVEVQGTLVATQWNYGTTSFILDHPVYCELDSSVLELDGGYVVANQFPLTFPISFSSSSSILFSTTF